MQTTLSLRNYLCSLVFLDDLIRGHESGQRTRPGGAGWFTGQVKRPLRVGTGNEAIASDEATRRRVDVVEMDCNLTRSFALIELANVPSLRLAAGARQRGSQTNFFSAYVERFNFFSADISRKTNGLAGCLDSTSPLECKRSGVAGEDLVEVLCGEYSLCH